MIASASLLMYSLTNVLVVYVLAVLPPQLSWSPQVPLTTFDALVSQMLKKFHIALLRLLVAISLPEVGQRDI